MDNASSLPHKKVIQDILRDYCCHQPRTFTEMLHALEQHRRSQASQDSDLFTTGEAISVLFASINEDYLLLSPHSTGHYYLNPAYAPASLGLQFPFAFGTTDQTSAAEEAANKVVTLAEFRDFLKFLSLFYDVATGSYAYPVISPKSLGGSSIKSKQSTASQEAPAGANGFSLVQELKFSSTASSTQGGATIAQAQLRLYDRDFSLLHMGTTNTDDKASMVLGCPLLITSKNGHKELVPLFYFSLSKLQWDAQQLHAGEVIGPFYNDAFPKKMLELYDSHHKSFARGVMRSFALELASKMQHIGDGDTALLDLCSLAITFFGEFCYGMELGLKGAGNIGLVSLPEFKALEQRIVMAAMVAPPSKSTYSAKTSQDFQQILQASDQELMCSALSCFFFDPRTAMVRAGAEAASFAENMSADSIGEARDFNAFGVTSKGSLVFDFDPKMPCDDDQRQAVRSMLQNDLTILQGPPGTGKTQTVVNAAYNHLIRGQKVLVTSFNNAAISAFYGKARLPQHSVGQQGEGVFRLAKLLKSESNSALTFDKLACDILKRTKEVNPQKLQTFAVFGKTIANTEQEIQQLERICDDYERVFNAQQSQIDVCAQRFVDHYSDIDLKSGQRHWPRFVEQLLQVLFMPQKQLKSKASAQVTKDSAELQNLAFQVRFYRDDTQQRNFNQQLDDLQNVLTLADESLQDTYEQLPAWKRVFLRRSLRLVLPYLKTEIVRELLTTAKEFSAFERQLCARKERLQLSQPEVPTLDVEEINERINAAQVQLSNNVLELISQLCDFVPPHKATSEPEEQPNVDAVDDFADDNELLEPELNANAAGDDANSTQNSTTTGTGNGAGKGTGKSKRNGDNVRTSQLTTRELKSELRNLKNVPNADKLLNKYASKVLDFFPITTTSLLSVASSLPLKSGLLDLVIFDEAAQFNFINAIPILFRAKRAAIIGDPKQLPQVGSYSQSAINKISNVMGLSEKLRLRFNVNDSLYDFVRYGCAYNDQAAIKTIKRLSVIGTADTSEQKAKTVLLDSTAEALPELILRQNRRSVPDIVHYISQSFYQEQLIPSRQFAVHELKHKGLLLRSIKLGMTFCPVDNDEMRRPSDGSSSSRYFPAEIEKSLTLLQQIFKQGYKGTVGVIAPYRAHCQHLLAEILQDPYLKSVYTASPQQLIVDTVHRFQGMDCDTVIYNLCLMGEGREFALDEHIINVALSRARDYLLVVGSAEAVSKCAHVPFMQQMLPWVQDACEPHSAHAAKQGTNATYNTANDNAASNDYSSDTSASSVRSMMLAQALFKRNALATPCFDTRWEAMLYQALKFQLEQDSFFREVPCSILTQLPMLDYRLDLALVYGNRGLDIECDGAQHYVYWCDPQHNQPVASDLERARRLQECQPISFATMRFRNSVIESDPESCAREIVAQYKQLISEVRGGNAHEHAR